MINVPKNAEAMRPISAIAGPLEKSAESPARVWGNRPSKRHELWNDLTASRNPKCKHPTAAAVPSKYSWERDWAACWGVARAAGSRPSELAAVGVPWPAGRARRSVQTAASMATRKGGVRLRKAEVTRGSNSSYIYQEEADRSFHWIYRMRPIYKEYRLLECLFIVCVYFH